MSIAVRAADLLELGIMMLQMVGVVSLVVCRLAPCRRWTSWAHIVFFASLFGLALAGAIVAHSDSEFALFAGGTITVLLIGMTLGTSSLPRRADISETPLLG